MEGIAEQGCCINIDGLHELLMIEDGFLGLGLHNEARN